MSDTLTCRRCGADDQIHSFYGVCKLCWTETYGSRLPRHFISMPNKGPYEELDGNWESPTVFVPSFMNPPKKEELPTISEEELSVHFLQTELKKAKEIIRINNLCHDKHGKVGACEFAKGCEAEQIKIFGHSPTQQRIQNLKGVIESLRAHIRSENKYIQDLLKEISRQRRELNSYKDNYKKRTDWWYIPVQEVITKDFIGDRFSIENLEGKDIKEYRLQFTEKGWRWEVIAKFLTYPITDDWTPVSGTLGAETAAKPARLSG